MSVLNAVAGDYVNISGKVTDYKGNSIDLCYVCIYNPDFSTAYETYSDSQGIYHLDSIVKGRYTCLAAMRLDEYPRTQGVSPKDMKLEFWAWNVIANEDLNLNIRYDKLHEYCVEAFHIG